VSAVQLYSIADISEAGPGFVKLDINRRGQLSEKFDKSANLISFTEDKVVVQGGLAR